MRIAILGATSQIARDYIERTVLRNEIELFLFGRDTQQIHFWLATRPEAMRCRVHHYAELDSSMEFDVIMNFVGVGNPALAKAMGSEIFYITRQYDMSAIAYIEKNPKCKYIFLSSGAAYGGDFLQPADETTPAIFDINNLVAGDWYGISKFYAEVIHRSLPYFSIVDIRVFSYFSASQDLNARFLMSDVVRSIQCRTAMITSADNVVRDYITPIDFEALVDVILQQGGINKAIDIYSQAPVDKFTLLDAMSSRFGLRYEIKSKLAADHNIGIKKNYFSINKHAKVLGYEPKHGSLSGIIEQIEKTGQT